MGEPAESRHERRERRLRLGLFAGLLIGALVSGGYFVKFRREQVRKQIHRELAAIGELKRRQIANWRSERLNEGRSLVLTPFVVRDVARLLARPTSGAARDEAASWLELLTHNGRYEAAMLYDAAFNLRLTVSVVPGVSPHVRRELLEQAFAARDATLTDLLRDEATGGVHLDVLAPIFAPGQKPDQAGARPIAAIALRLNPTRFLFPLLQTWPMPSKTAETLLVRRDADDVVFLSELRHASDTALKLRRPLRDARLPAAMAARGETGVQEGIDYRGVPVLAVSEAVPDSNWLMVSKMDRDEAFAPLRRETWISAAVAGLLLLTLGFGMFWLAQARREHLLRRVLEAEQARRGVAERLALVTRHASDIIFLIDDTGRIVEANDRAVEVYGYSLDELRALQPGDLRAPETRAAMEADLRRVDSPEGALVETVHRRKDGSVLPVEINARAVEIEGRRFKLGIIRDISERRRVEAELRESEERFRTLVQLSPDAMFINQNNRVVYMNRRGLELWRARGEAEVLGRPPLELIHPDSRELVGARIRAFLERGTAAPLQELKILTLDGAAVDVETVAAPFVHGGAPAIQVIVREITERKRAEAALRFSEAKFAQAFASNPAAIALTRMEDGVVLEVNDTWVTLCGFTREEVVGRSARAMWVDQEAAARFVRELREHGIVRNWEQAFRKKSGEIFTAMLWTKRLEIGNQEMILSTLVDVTARRKAEAALRENQQLLQSITDNSTSLIYALDRDGRFLLINRRLEAVFGRAREQLLGLPREAILPPEVAAAHRANDLTVIATRKAVSVEEQNIEADGVHTYLSVKFPLFDEQGEPQAVGGISTDITQRVRAEAEVRDLNAELEHRVTERTAELTAANQELEAFSYSVSHDLRAPLRAVDGFSLALLEDFGAKLDPEAQRYLKLIRGGAQHMGELIDDLLALSRLGRKPLDRRPVDMSALVRTVLADCGGECEGRELAVTVGALPEAEGDAVLLRQVWANLIGNALKYTRRRAAATIEIGARVEDGATVYFVRDNGAGFDMRYAGKLFGVFQRLHRSEDYEGTGVGLAIVQRVVHRHGGRVWAEAAVEHGATFSFTLERRPAP